MNGFCFLSLNTLRREAMVVETPDSKVSRALFARPRGIGLACDWPRRGLCLPAGALELALEVLRSVLRLRRLLWLPLTGAFMTVAGTFRIADFHSDIPELE